VLASWPTGAIDTLPCYLQGQFQPGRQTRWWSKHSVMCLAQRLEQLGSRLVIRRARESVEGLKAFITETGAEAVFFNHLYDSISMVRDQQVKDDLRSNRILVSSFNADLLYEPWEVLDDQQQVSS
jgi:cryptochrome 1